jgi:transposase
MRGRDDQHSQMFSYLSPETRVRKGHPLRAIREVLTQLSRRFDTMFVASGRPSIPPEKLLRALHMVYSIRSERLLIEEIDYSMLFRWFVGLNLDEEVWDAKNRDRLLEADVAKKLLAQVVAQAATKGLTSDAHFTVAKSFQRRDGQNPASPYDPRNPTVNFHGDKRSNQTHVSKTDPGAKLARKGKGKEAKLSYSGNLLVENRNGLIVNSEVFEANSSPTSRAPRPASQYRLSPPAVDGFVPGIGYDTFAFVAERRNLRVTPHLAQNHERRGGSAIDERTTRHQGYRISQIKRMRIEECFGWLKTIVLLRKVRYRGIFKVGWVFSFAYAAYNLLRMRNLGGTAIQSA